MSTTTSSSKSPFSRRLRHLWVGAAAGLMVAAGTGAAEAQFGIRLPRGPGIALPLPIPFPHQGGRVVVVPNGGQTVKVKRGGGTVEKASPGDDSRPSSRETDRQLAALLPSDPKVSAVLKRVTVASAVATVNSTDEIGATVRSEESRRDLTGSIDELIQTLKRAQVNQGGRDTVGDINSHSVESALDKAYAAANLREFERFKGENWTADRFKVLILERVTAELPRLLDGTNKGVVQMAALEELIGKAAVTVYRRAFETTELFAMNASVAKLVKYMWETGFPVATGGDGRGDVGQMAIDSATRSISGFEARMAADDNAFALRYRAMHVAVDCLAGEMKKLAAERRAASFSPRELADVVVDVGRGECRLWLDDLFADANRSKLAAPLPQRAEWSAKGALVDASMYAQPGGTF